MRSVFKLTGYFADFSIMKNYEFDSVYSMSSIDEIVANVLPKYIDHLKGYFDDDDDSKLHHITITGYPLDRPITDCEFLSEYVYLPDETLYISREYHNFWGEGNFKGRDEVPLKVGDKIVWFGGNGNIYKGVVYGLPPKIGQFTYLDESDDCYTILEDMSEIPEPMTDEIYMHNHQHIGVDIVFKDMVSN